MIPTASTYRYTPYTDSIGGFSSETSTSLPDIRYVKDWNAIIRLGAPGFKSTGSKISYGSLVQVINTATKGRKTYLLVAEPLRAGHAGAPRVIGWTAVTNLKSNNASSLNWRSLKSEMVRNAQLEFNLWNNSVTRRESNPITFNRQKQYWANVGLYPSDANLADPVWQNSKPWSAAFISFVIRQAGAGDGFLYNGKHACYTVWARKNREIAYAQNPFWAYASNAPEAAWPEPGDIICKNRGGGRHTLDSLLCEHFSHCDIVVEVDRANRTLVAIGGNVDNRVARTRLTLDANGHIDPSARWHIEGTNTRGSQAAFFAVIKVRTPPPVTLPPPVSSTLPGNPFLRPGFMRFNVEGTETQTPSWCQIRNFITALAQTEEMIMWRDPFTGNQFKEDEPEMLSILEKYWQAVRGKEANPPKHRNVDPPVQAQRSANDIEAWSAAFISWVVRASHVKLSHGFEFSRRHISYIVQAMVNRELSDRSKPFWLYGKDEMDQVNIEKGDILCFNRKVKGTWTRHSYERLRRKHWDDQNKNLKKAIEDVKGSSHCNIVVDFETRGRKRFVVPIGGNEGHTVKRSLMEIKPDGTISNNSNLRFFGIIKLVGCNQGQNRPTV